MRANPSEWRKSSVERALLSLVVFHKIDKSDDGHAAMTPKCARLDSPQTRAIRVPTAIQAGTARSAQVLAAALWFKRKNLIMKEVSIFHVRLRLTFSFGSIPTEVNRSLA